MIHRRQRICCRIVPLSSWGEVRIHRGCLPIRAGGFHGVPEKSGCAGPADKTAALDMQEGTALAHRAGGQERKALRGPVEDAPALGYLRR